MAYLQDQNLKYDIKMFLGYKCRYRSKNEGLDLHIRLTETKSTTIVTVCLPYKSE